MIHISHAALALLLVGSGTAASWIPGDTGRHLGACAIDSAWTAWAPRPSHLDERIAFQVSEYAGMSREPDAPGDVDLLVVQLTEVEKAPDALIVIRRELERAYHRAPRHVRFIKVKYSYRQLCSGVSE